MAEVFGNNPTTTLNGGITNVATSLIVTSATNFPVTGNFHIIIDNEILLVTAVAGTTFTVTRGQEGSTAASHANLAAVDNVLTEAGLDNAIDDRVATHTALQNAHHNQNHGDGDHSFNLTTAPVTIGTANAAGGGTNHAGALHVHAGLGQPVGLAGATAAAQFAGATTSGAPVAVSPFSKGDYIVSRNDGQMYVCTTAGSPGTWTAVGSGTVTFGTLGDLTDIAASETLGATTRVSDAGHVHAHGSGYLVDAHHTEIHSDAQHTNLSRSVFIESARMSAIGTTTPNAGSGNEVFATTNVADTFDAGVRGTFMIPDDWVSGLALQIYWLSSTTVVSNVRFQTIYKSSAAGDNVLSAGTTQNHATEAVGTADILQISAAQNVNTGVGAGEFYRFTTRRMASTDALDTYNGIVRFLGLKFTYTANQ